MRSHSNPNKGTDPEATWTAKDYAKGKPKQKQWFWGFKLHLVVDAVTELPIEAHVTTASRQDTNELLPSLHHAKERFDWFKPEWVLADKGYDSATNFKGVAELGVELAAQGVPTPRAPLFPWTGKGDDSRPHERGRDAGDGAGPPDCG